MRQTPPKSPRSAELPGPAPGSGSGPGRGSVPAGRGWGSAPLRTRGASAPPAPRPQPPRPDPSPPGCTQAPSALARTHTPNFFLFFFPFPKSLIYFASLFRRARVTNEALEITSIINCANLFLLNKNNTYWRTQLALIKLDILIWKLCNRKQAFWSFFSPPSCCWRGACSLWAAFSLLGELEMRNGDGKSGGAKLAAWSALIAAYTSPHYRGFRWLSLNIPGMESRLDSRFIKWENECMMIS